MGDPRYTVEEETAGKWLTEEVVESAGHDADEGTRVTITDEKTGKSVSGAGSDYDEALEVACEKMGISEDDLEAELGDDDDDDEDIDDDDEEVGSDEE